MLANLIGLEHAKGISKTDNTYEISEISLCIPVDEQDNVTSEKRTVRCSGSKVLSLRATSAQLQECDKLLSKGALPLVEVELGYVNGPNGATVKLQSIKAAPTGSKVASLS